ncbi:hypothetical protein J2Z62_000408 [Mycoplasmoides fastidiosum]|uniref:Lipoprotein n=1 Tax=Mycoplasmoides fastidiosum TaxID=92758 RepID=A0ABU0LZ45_9BACT|nr:hypothetical protein [Mycoplasmoides fastidiosum]MDQ0513970.1 hypothetical protein [Mycoplasmoides fastidiosum]UUD37616.1 hypothetical protein NPA10_03550 [Mycoplasmoides fastidiosum]
MKKFKFLHRKNFWLASFGWTITSSLVLAACAHNPVVDSQQTKPNNSEAMNNSANPEPTKPDQSNQNNLDIINKTEDASKPGSDQSNNDVIPPSSDTSQISAITQATQQQIVDAKRLLQQAEIKTVLNNNKEVASKKIKANILTVTKIGKFSQETVANSKQALGTTSDAIITTIDGNNEKNQSVAALVKTLESQLNAPTTTVQIVPTDKKTDFSKAINDIKIHANNLLSKLNDLPATVTTDTNIFHVAKTTFESALDSYSSATTTENLQTAWLNLKKAQDDFQAKLNEAAPKLVAIQKAALELDKTTSWLESFINTDVANFLSNTTNGSQNSKILNALVAKVRTNVLGTLGHDLWATDDAPPGAESDTQPSTQLYAIVVGLANQTTAWNNLEHEIKSLTFNQNLLLGVESAINIFAQHLETLVPVDVARLNAYLIFDQSNLLKILHSQSSINTIEILEKIAKGVNQYATLLGSSEEETLVKKLTTLAAKVSDASRQTKVNTLKTAAEGLVTKFTAFKTEWDKLQDSLWIMNQSQIKFPLLEGAVNLNRLIGLANNYGDVLQALGQALSLRAIGNKIVDAVSPTLSSTSQEEQSPLIKSLQAIITEIKNTADNSFGKALDEFAKETQWTETNKSEAEAIAHSNTTSTPANTGLIYTDLVEGTMATTGTPSTPAKLSFEQLKTELEKLQDVGNKPLYYFLGLLGQQLQPSDGSQTARLTNHLAEMFNNGNILPETQIHNS